MASGPVRVEVDDEHGTVAEIVSMHDLPPRARARLGELADGLISEVAALLGTDERRACEAVVAELARLVADEAAYERVAERRGLLPL